MPIARKIDYARGLLAGVVRTAPGQVQSACEAKGVAFDSPLAGEDWIGGPYVIARHLRLLIESLEDLRPAIADLAARLPAEITEHNGGLDLADPEVLRTLLPQVEQMLLPLLLDSEEEAA